MMSHCIGYLEYRKSKISPRKIMAELNGFAYDPQETSGYHGNLKFHDSPVYKSRKDAEEAIKKMDRGWYDDHAVLYKDGRKIYWLVKYEYHC